MMLKSLLIGILLISPVYFMNQAQIMEQTMERTQLMEMHFIDEDMDGFCDTAFSKDSLNGAWMDNRPWDEMPDHPSKGNSNRNRLDHNMLQTKP